MAIVEIAAGFDLTTVVARQMSRFRPILRMMLRGVRFRTDLKETLDKELSAAVKAREERIHFLAGRALNPESPKQLNNYFYRGLGIPEVKNRKTGAPTCDESALSPSRSGSPSLG